MELDTAPVAPPGIDRPPAARAWRVLAVTLVAAFMAVFDLYVVNIAAPALRTDLHTGDGALELVVSGYAFSYAAGLVTGGRLGDRYGYRRVFIAGTTAFTAASLLCALAENPAQLVVFRLLQGLAAAVMAPQVLSLITVVFPREHRARATAWYGAVGGLGALCGQILGGALLQADPAGLGWRSIFLVNVPVGAAAALLALVILPRGARGGSARFDPVGATAFSLTLALVLAPLALGRQLGWPVWCWISLAAAVPAGYGALAWQRALLRRGGSPIIDPGLFRNRGYTAMLGAASLYQLYFGGFLFALTLLVQSRPGSTPEQAALVFLAQGVFFTLASMPGGRLTARHGPRVMIAGGAPAAAGLLALIGLGDPAGPVLAAVLALIGLGNGLLLPPLLGAALGRVDAGQAGAASGTLTTTQQFANSLGVTVLGTLFFTAAGPGLRAAAGVMQLLTAVCLLLVLAVVLLIRTAPRPEN